MISKRKLGDAPYTLKTRTVAQNAFKILRAMVLDKSILLEGSPRVGKTSLIESLAKICGKDFVRVNLNDQTDCMDLFGCDLPTQELESDGKQT